MSAKGKTIVELAAELERQESAKRDFVVDTRQLGYVPGRDHPESTFVEPDRIVVHNGDQESFPLTQHTHSQLAARLGIPAAYYKRMRQEAPELLGDSLRTWWQQKPERRMVRTLDGQARAYLSDRYRRFDNSDVARAVLPALGDIEDMAVHSCEVTDRRLYIKAIFPKVEAEVKVGDVVQSGVIISNSEIGAGSTSVEPFILRLVCTNGMVSKDHAMKRHHVGRQIAGEGDAVFELFADETLAADEKAYTLKLRDTVKALASPERFEGIVSSMRDAAGQKLMADPVKSVEVLSGRVGATEYEKGDFLRSLIEGGDLSRWGVANAITATARDCDDYDRGVELEVAGGRLLADDAMWREVASASS